jgi:hypothetical protein
MKGSGSSPPACPENTKMNKKIKKNKITEIVIARKRKRKRKKKPLKFGRCRKSGDCPEEDLAKSGYKSELNYKSLVILLYLWLHNESHI